MGFDISYHPITLDEMNLWYFDQLTEVRKDDFSKLQALGEQYCLNEFYINKYIDTMKVAAGTGNEECFEKSHAYYIAVVQGFFSTYYYTRGTAFSFLIRECPEMKNYTTSWTQIKPDTIHCPITDTINENYSGGIYIAPKQVDNLLENYNNDEIVQKILKGFFEENLPVFLKALQDASSNHKGLLEATEVVEPQPVDLSKSTSFSNLANCDKDGAFVYQNVARSQLEEFAAQMDLNTADIIDKISYQTTINPKEELKRSFWKKLFNK